MNIKEAKVIKAFLLLYQNKNNNIVYSIKNLALSIFLKAYIEEFDIIFFNEIYFTIQQINVIFVKINTLD